MADVREQVEINAPIDRVWAVVHEDFKNASKWTNNLERVDRLTEGPLAKGTRLRYVLATPGGHQDLEVLHTTVTRGKTCAGTFVKGPVKGDWKYAYQAVGEATRLTYSMTYEPNGFAARLFFGMIEKQLPNDLAKTLANLKRYIESGRGGAPGVAKGAKSAAAPKAAPQTAVKAAKPAPPSRATKAKR